MGVTVKLAGVPPSVSVEDLAVSLNKILDNPDIGTFRVRELDPNKCNSTKRWIALDFRSGYDAMYAQDSLHGKEYTLPDRTIVILQAKVTKDPKYMPLDSFEQLKTTLPYKALHHSVEEPSNSSSIQPIDNDLPKIKKKPHQKSDKKIKSKLKKIEKKEYELLMEKARLQRELNELSEPEDVPPKKRRSSDVGSKRNSLVDHFSDSSSLRRSSSRDPRASLSRSRRDSSPGDSDSEDVPPKKRRAIKTPDVGTKRISSADHLARKLFRKTYSDVIDSPTLETRRSSSRDLSRSLSRDARASLSRNPGRSSSRNSRDSSSRDPKESLYQDWRDNPRDARDILNRDPRHSTSRDLRDSLSCDRKRKMSYLENRRSSYHELGHGSPRDPRDSSSRDLRDSSTREFRDASYYGSKDTYSRELSVIKEKSTSRELSSAKTPKSLKKAIYESEEVPKTRKGPLDAETKVKVEGVKIKSEASESNVGINIRDEAIKDILLETEKLFTELCAKHTVSDADKKRVLKNLFDVINKRMKGLKITSEMGVSCVIMHYRCKYSKVEDNAFLTELFENLVSCRNEDEPQPETESPASPAADNIWNIVDAVLQEFELETLEDIKPKIEPLEEEQQTVNITVTTDKDNIKTQYTIQDEVNGYYINIIMDKKRIKKFYITIRILLKEMKIHIERYTSYVYCELLEYVLRGILEKRIVKVLVGKEYMKAKALWSLYRKKYTLEQDGPLVLQTVYDIWEGKYNDEYVSYENNTAVTDSNSNETEKNKEINETPKDTPVVKAEKDNEISQETPEVKTEKDKEVNETSKETPEAITKDKETNDPSKEIPAVKTEKDKEVNDISKENPKVIAKDKEATETSKETPEVKPEKNKVNHIVSKATPAVKMDTDEEMSVLNADKTVTVKTEQINKENNTVQTRNGSKEVDKMNTTSTLNKDMIKSEKAADTNTATTESGVTSNVTAKETEIQKFDNGDEDVIFVENSDVVKVVSDTIKSAPGKHSNDDDVLVVESKIEVIDLSDADDTRNTKEKAVEAVTKSKNLNMENADQIVLALPADDILDINVSSDSEIDTPDDDTHKQNVTTEALATMATNKTKEAPKATADTLQSAKPMNKPSIDDDVICLSDNENDVIEVVDCETPFDSKITDAAHTSQNLEDAEETGTVPAEAHGNVDDEVNIIDDNDDNASVDTLILNEDHYLDISEDDHAVELNQSDIIEQNTSETANDLKIATVHVEVTKIRPEQKVINDSETDNCNDTVLSNNLGKVTGGVIESCEERNSSLFVEDVEESIQSIQNFLQKTSH